MGIYTQLKQHFSQCMNISQTLSHQQVYFLCLLDLPTAFDTLHHAILLHRLSSWFGLSSLSPQWFTSYLSCRKSAVAIPPHLSPSSSHLQCSARLCPRSHSFHYISQFSYQLFHHFTPTICRRHKTFRSLIQQLFAIL